MTYAKNSTILASDYNTLTGGLDVSSAFASAAAATHAAAGLFGVGFGDRGYGQTTPTIPAVIAGTTTINTTQWSNLRSIISTLASHQGTTATLLPASGAFAAGQSVVAEVPATTSYDIPTMLVNVDTNRFNTDSGASMTLSGAALTITRASAWGAASGSITAVGQADFASEDQARYFFNSGGEIRLALNHASTATAQDTDWGTTLAGVGNIKFAANGTSRTGAKGTAQAIGYFQLTTSYQLIFDGTNIGGGIYTANDVLVYAKAVAITGSNGAKGYQVQFQIVLQDQHTNAFSDSVASGTKVDFSYLKATAVLSGIVTPTFTNITNF